MPYTLTWERLGVHLKFSGDVNIRSRFEALEAICSDPRFDGLLFAIVDYLDVRDYEATDAAIEEIAALQIGAFRTNPRIVIASVATQPEIVAALNRLIGLGFIKAPQAILPSLELARAWIQRHRDAPR